MLRFWCKTIKRSNGVWESKSSGAGTSASKMSRDGAFPSLPSPIGHTYCSDSW